MKKGEIAVSGFCLVFFAFMLFESWELRAFGRAGEVGSAFWPMAALVILTILSLVWLIKNLRKAVPGKEPGDGASKEKEEAKSGQWGARRKIGLCLATLLLYIVIMPWIGFVLSTTLFVFAFMMALEEKRPLVLILSPFLITAVATALFGTFIMMPLPKGVGIFAEFSRLFYM